MKAKKPSRGWLVSYGFAQAPTASTLFWELSSAPMDNPSSGRGRALEHMKFSVILLCMSIHPLLICLWISLSIQDCHFRVQDTKLPLYDARDVALQDHTDASSGAPACLTPGQSARNPLLPPTSQCYITLAPPTETPGGCHKRDHSTASSNSPRTLP